MHMTLMPSRARWVLAAGVIALLTMGACKNSVTDSLLDAQDPDIIDPNSVNSAEAADALRIGALSRLRTITAGGEGAWMLGGLMTDEWKSGDTFLQRNETDQRLVQVNNANVQTMYRDLHRARTSAREAIIKLNEFKPLPSSNIGQMYFVMGFAEMTLAENFCSGQPFSDASSGQPTYGNPLSTTQAFQLALAHFDSALTLSQATDAATVAIRNSIQIARARTLINLKQYDNAATAVTSVPTSYQLLATFSLTAGSNQIWSLNTSAKRWVVGDSFDVGGIIANAIPFASAGDTRVRVSGTSTGTSPAGKSFDGSTNFISQSMYGRTDNTAIVSGIDARLMEAEVRLQKDDIAGMMTILNGLRDTSRTLGSINTAVMPALPTPATKTDAINLYFREKAFWTFGRGQRLPDLRRLIRDYGRTAAQVFPSGQFFKGGTYGNDVNFPATVDEENNPNYHGCANRNA